MLENDVNDVHDVVSENFPMDRFLGEILGNRVINVINVLFF